MTAITIKNTGKRIQVLFDKNSLLTDSGTYQAKQYINAHYLETKGAMAIKGGYSFPPTEYCSLEEWENEFNSVIESKDLSKRNLF